MKFMYENGELVQVKSDSSVKRFLRDDRNKYIISTVLIASSLLAYFLLDGGASFLALKLYSLLDSVGWGNLIQQAFQILTPATAV